MMTVAEAVPMTRAQRWLVVVAAVAGCLVFLAASAYWAFAADGHPRVKHTLLFLGLAGVSALIAWFGLPEGVLQRQRSS